MADATAELISNNNLAGEPGNTITISQYYLLLLCGVSHTLSLSLSLSLPLSLSLYIYLHSIIIS